MSHPDRRTYAQALYGQLSGDPFTDIEIIQNEKDDGTLHEREWDNGERCLRWGVGKADYHVVIQDDAILTDYFYENLVSAIEATPVKSLMSLYTGQSRPFPQRVSAGVEKAPEGSFLQFWLLLWGVCIVIPSDHIEPMLEFVEGMQEQYDNRIGIFYQRNMLPIYYTMPSLVDHDDNLPSLLGHGIAPGRRIAHRPAKNQVTFTGEVIDI